MGQPTLTPAFFQQNRVQLADTVPPQSLIIIRGNTLVPRTDGQFYPFHQDSDFFYFTGVDLEDCALIIKTDANQAIETEILLHPAIETLELVWTGRIYALQDIIQSDAFDRYGLNSDFEYTIHTLLQTTNQLILDEKQAHHFSEELQFNVETTLPRFQLKTYSNELRAIKQEVEIAIMKEACAITAKGLEDLREKIQQGVYEYELANSLRHTFLEHQASGLAYPPIIASGSSGILLHYQQNNKMLQMGDLVLVDVGACYEHYQSDITRVFPVNGVFTPRQRAAYKQVKQVLEQLIGLLKPGLTFQALEEAGAQMITKALLDLGVLTAAMIQQDAKAYKAFMPHRFAHLIGLDVHEDTSSRLLKAGMVLAIEPGIYIPKEGLAIRLEDNVLITEQGSEVLSLAPFED